MADLKPISAELLQEKLSKKNAPVVETKVETPANTVEQTPVVEKPVVAETKPELKKEEKGTTTVGEQGKVEEKPKKKIKESLRSFTPKGADQAPTPENEIPEQFKSKFTEYENKLSESQKRIAELQADTDLELIREMKKAGKTAFDIFREAQAEDISKLTDLQLMEKDLRAAGVKPSDEVDGDEPTLEDELEKFKAMPKTARDREIAAIKQKYETANQNKASDLLNKLKTHNQQNEQSANAERTKQIEQAQKTMSEWESYCDSYNGQEHLGVVGTPAMVESLKNVLKNPEGLFLKTDGSLDVNKLFKAAHFLLFEDLMLENLENQIEAETTKRIMDEVSVTGGAKGNIVRTPQTPTLTDREVANHIHSTLRPVNN